MALPSEAVPATLREVDEGWQLARKAGDRMITDYLDDHVIRVSWLPPEGPPYLEATYDRQSGELMQAPLF